jgi:lipoprotein-releasing system permease protein
MRYETFVALRYLRARRKQAVISAISLISALGFMVGVAALVIALALMTGFREDIQSRLLSAGAHLVVSPLGRGETLENYKETAARIAAIPGVEAASAVLYEKGLLMAPESGISEAVLLKGVKAEAEKRVTTLTHDMEEGSLESLEGEGSLPRIVLGADLADTLGVSAGDRLRLLSARTTLTPFGPMPRSRNFEVGGVFRSGLYLYDSNWALVSLEAAQALRGEGDVAESIEVRVKNPDTVEKVEEAVLQGASETLLTVNWKEMNQSLFSAFKVEKLLMFLAIGLIVVVASFNIVSILMLMVMEKHRDIGILKTFGALPGGIARIFVIQGAAAGAAGTVLGAALGIAACLVMDRWRLIRLSPEVYLIPYVPFHVHALDVAVVVAAAMGVALLATLYPAKLAARLRVVEALRHE